MMPARTVAFRLASTASALGALYHAAALAVPAFATLAYPPSYPAWRHAIFLLTNAGFAWLLLSRPIWLIWPYAALTMQAVSSHGQAAWEWWRETGRVDWISVAVVVWLPLVLTLLFLDWRERRSAVSAATDQGLGTKDGPRIMP